MEYKKTICHKITEGMKEVEKAVRFGHFDAGKLAELMIEVKSDAIKMENALKANKKLREKHHIDAEYRSMIGEGEKSTADVNEIKHIDEQTKQQANDAPLYDLTLKDQSGKVLYHNSKLFAFLMSAVEKVHDVDVNGVIEGETQVLTVGNDLAVWFGYDQFKQKFADRYTGLLLKKNGSVNSGQFANREMKRKFLRAANGKRVI